MNCKAFALILTATLAGLSPLRAEQGGAGHYISGATASFIDALPDQPGWVVESLFMNYNGTYGMARGLPFGDNIALDVTATATAESPLVMYTPPFQVLGGRPSFAVAIPFTWIEVNARATIDERGVPHLTHQSGKANGLGDIEFWPLMLGWTNHDFKYDVRCAVYAPSGGYDKSHLANTGLGYWTFEPEVTFSWLSSKFGTEVSLFTGLDFNTLNTDADYQSGNIFHLDGTVAQHLPLLGGVVGVGANGFYYQQITGDSGAGARLGSFEASSYGVGPVLSYVRQLGKTQLVIEAKWLPQLGVEHTTRGNYVWFKAALLF
jgi:hypothetical protein